MQNLIRRQNEYQALERNYKHVYEFFRVPGTCLGTMRRELWKENDTYRESIKDVNASIYTNHTWMKKFGTPLFNYDTERENEFLFVKQGEVLENEWCIDRNGEFKPGIIPKKSFVLR